ncbi:MAG TPA: hypothetical protein PLW48_00080 [Alphaproteobacteria bacterium]|nr:hypothetical protein [Alphaproteobacteria bacterium]HRJ65506.1 hypothetical protein [Alphaproteobacteria bacterium]
MIRKEKSMKKACAVIAALAMTVSFGAASMAEQPAEQAAAAEQKVVKQRVETITTTRQILPPTGTRLVNLMDFDANNDGVLSTREVGEMLFKLFDSDGNMLIDNQEFEKRNVMSLVPMEKETVVQYDFDNDGLADKVERAHETFMKKTQLSRFDMVGEGISPHDFMGKSFMLVDIDRSRFVEINEWRGAYDALINQQNQKQVYFNR